MINKKINSDWVDFGEKIVYIYEKLFENDKEKLILYFSDQSLLHRQKNRKKTIENWLNGEIKKPNIFYLSKFKINEYELNGEQLLPIQAFKKWGFKQFKDRIDLYLEEKQSFDIPNEMKYIYFFNSSEKKLSYFEITYQNVENDAIIHLNSPLYTSSMTYKGTLTTYNNMTYISVRNEFDYMHYIFKNNVDVYRKELKVFGVAQCVDALTHEPKSYLALLTTNKLTQEEERKFSHKLNFSNLMIADDFTDRCRIEEDYFLENFLDKIEYLSRDIHHYSIDQHFAEDMYFDIVLKEYKSYITLLKKSFFRVDYPIDHKRQSILFALEDMCQIKESKATILYLLNSETLNILDTKNSIMEMQLKLVKNNKLELSYLFVVQDIALISQKIIQQISYLEKNGIKIMLTTNTQSIHSKILIVKDKNFAIYKRKNDHNDNHVTKNMNTIESLTYEVEELHKMAISLDDFVHKYYPLNGTWYHYTFSSFNDSKKYLSVKIEIKNSSLVATFPSGDKKGTLLETHEYTLMLMEQSLIKVQNINLHENLFRVSIIGNERKMHHRDILLFGLMSRKKLSEEQIMHLLNSIHKKEDKKYWLKISNDFDSVLADFEI